MREHEVESLMVRLMGDASSYQAALHQAENSTKQFASQITGVLTGIVGGGTILGGAFKAVDLAADAESMKTSFRVMLGSASAARKTVEELQKFAAETPLNLGPLQGFTRQLLQAGVNLDEIIPTLKSLGDVALGDANKLNSLVYAFGQIKTFGHLMGGELMQLRNAGFDPLAEISRTTGKSIGDLRNEMRKGLISFAMVENAFKTASSAGGRFADGMKEASKDLKGLFSTLKDDADAFLRAVGVVIVDSLKLKEVVKALSTSAQEATKWFQSLSPEIKAIAAAIGIVVTAAGTLLLVWPLIATQVGIAFALISGAISFVLSPLGLVVAAVVALGALIVNEMGGPIKVWETLRDAATEAWDRIKTRTNEFLEWSRPIWLAIQQLGVTAWEETKKAALIAWDGIKAAWNVASNFFSSLWNSLSEAVGISWSDIRDFILDTLIIIEFGLKNFVDVAILSWTMVQLDFVRLGNIIEHFFTGTMPALLNFFSENWRNIFTDLFNWTTTVWTNYAKNVVTLVKSIPALIKGSMSIADLTDLMKPLEEGFKRVTKEFIGPERVAGQLEKELEQSVDAQSEALKKALVEFRRQRLEQFKLPPDVIEPEEVFPDFGPDIDKFNQDTGETTVKSVKKEMEKLDAAVIGSAEAVSRISAARSAGQFGPSSTPAQTEVERIGHKQLGILDRIKELMQKQVDNPPVQIVDAGLV